MSYKLQVCENGRTHMKSNFAFAMNYVYIMSKKIWTEARGRGNVFLTYTYLTDF